MVDKPDKLIYCKMGHVNISFCIDNDVLLSSIRRWMKGFEISIPEEDENIIKVKLTHFDVDQPLPYKIPKQAKLTDQNDNAKYYIYRNLWIIELAQGIMIINRSNLNVHGLVYTKVISESVSELNLFMHPLYELMRQLGLYTHHSGAVSYNGFGLLLAGKSGQGKSTLSVDLLEKGFSFLSDDRCFLSNVNGQAEVIGIYEPAKLFASNINHISRLINIQGVSSDTHTKNYLDLRIYYPEKILQKSELRCIVFPSWSPNERSRLEIVAPGKALIELLPLSMVCFDAPTSKVHFEFLGELVSKIPSIRLVMGYDRENWHPLILDFITQSRG